MKKTLLALSLSCAGLFTSCGNGDSNSSDPNILVNNNFETIFGWIPETQSATITKEKAHSGVYSLKVDGTNEYSTSYRAALGKLSDKRINKIKVSGWAFATSPEAQASLIVTISDPTAPDSKPLLWEGIELNKGKEAGKWVEVSKEITFPGNVTPTNTLGMYMWRTSGNQAVYLDDLNVSIVP